MKTAFAYYRKSIENQSEKSIRSQSAAVQEYARKNNISIVGEYFDIASSANLNRDGFKTMFYSAIPKENVDFILVYSFDRITREMDDLGLILAQLKKYMGVKTRLHSITEENDYDDDHYKLFLIMMKTFGATEERIRIVNRLKAGKDRKKKSGGFVGGSCPIGYKTVQKSGTLHLDHELIPVVKKVFELRKESLTMQKIADKLNELGFKTRKGMDFKPMTVSRIIKNEKMYRGETDAPKIL